MYLAQGDGAQAGDLFARALAIRETQLGPDHADVAKNLEDYAGALRKSGRAAEAERLEARAGAIRAKTKS